MEFDDKGFAAGRPFGPAQWRQAISEMPDGVLMARQAFPPGFLVIQNFIDPTICDALVAECDSLPGIKQSIAAGASDTTAVASEERISETVDIYKLKTDVIEMCRAIFQNTVAPHYHSQIEWFERPEILRYKSGGLYKPHADAENWFSDKRQWRRVLDRDVSILVYLSDQFTGGEIAFPNFGISMQPTKGMLVVFPSDGRYLHTARAVQSGVRYALVSWAAVRGTARVQSQPGDIIRL